MTNDRYLQAEHTGILTEEELKEGWHWCPDWDFMLIGPEMEGEWDCCSCPEPMNPDPMGKYFDK